MPARVTTSLDDLMQLAAEARGFSFLPRQPVESLLAGRHASRMRGRGLAFEELRHYHQGDDVRHIDWNATARLRSPQVRVYTEERERPVLLVVDQRRPMFFGSRRTMKSVVAAELAALGAWRSLRAGDRVGGLVFDETEIVEVRPHRSRNRILQLLDAIVRFNQRLAAPNPDAPPKDNVGLNDALRAVLRVAHHDHLVVLIGDLDGADAETQRLATLIAAHNDMLVVAVYDPLGASLVGAPGMAAIDRGRTWELPPRDAFSEAFTEAFRQRVQQWTEIFRNLRVPVLPISTSTPAVDQLRDLFGHRPSTS